jgi:hypothetical protein
MMKHTILPFLPALLAAAPTPPPAAPQSVSGPFTYSVPDSQDRIYGSAELLYWNMAQLGLEGGFYKDYIVTGSGETGFNTGTNMGAQGTILQKTLGWHPGYRLNAGYSIPSSPCFVQGDYTDFRFHDAFTYNSDGGNFSFFKPSNLILNQTTGSLGMGRVTSLKTKVQFSYQTASVLFGAGWSPTARVAINGTLGPSAAWISQDLKYVFEGLARVANAEFDWTFRAPGLQAGIDLTTALGKGFGLTLDASLTGLWGSSSYTVNYAYEAAPNGTLSYQNVSDAGNIGKRRLVTLTRLMSGVSYGYRLATGTLSLTAGYEFTLIDNLSIQSRGTFVTDNATSTNANYRINPVILHGLSVDFGFAF